MEINPIPLGLFWPNIEGGGFHLSPPLLWLSVYVSLVQRLKGQPIKKDLLLYWLGKTEGFKKN